MDALVPTCIGALVSINQFTEKNVLKPLGKKIVEPYILSRIFKKTQESDQNHKFQHEATCSITTHTVIIIGAWLFKTCAALIGFSLLATAAKIVIIYAICKTIYEADKALASYFYYRPHERLNAFNHPVKGFGQGFLAIIKGAGIQVGLEIVNQEVKKELDKLDKYENLLEISEKMMRRNTISTLLEQSLTHPEFTRHVTPETSPVEREFYAQIMHLAIIHTIKSKSTADVAVLRLNLLFNNIGDIVHNEVEALLQQYRR